MYFREVYDRPCQCCQSVQSLFYRVSIWPHSKLLWHQDHLASKPRHPHRNMCHSIPTCSLFTSTCACVGWMTVSWQRKNCYVNLNSTQTTSSPVQVTQPSSTQDSFAKSNGPALLLSSLSSSLVFLCPSPALPHQARPPLFSLPPQRKDGRWWFVCQRLCRWMGNSRWVIWVGRMPQHLWNLWTPWNNVADTMVVLPLLSPLHCCSWCCFLCVTVGHTPLEGEEMSYFTNIVVHNI